ncbi:hypothetical protein FRB97_005829 [Tulasnella sp. 331]|nr:hypothetical protein FRB97_005829 [Tulasnella sp. 331]
MSRDGGSGSGLYFGCINWDKCRLLSSWSVGHKGYAAVVEHIASPGLFYSNGTGGSGGNGGKGGGGGDGGDGGNGGDGGGDGGDDRDDNGDDAKRSLQRIYVPVASAKALNAQIPGAKAVPSDTYPCTATIEAISIGFGSKKCVINPSGFNLGQATNGSTIGEDFGGKPAIFSDEFMKDCYTCYYLVVKARLAEAKLKEEIAALVEQTRKTERKYKLRDAEMKETHQYGTAEANRKEEMTISLSFLKLGQLTLPEVRFMMEYLPQSARINLFSYHFVNMIFDLAPLPKVMCYNQYVL